MQSSAPAFTHVHTSGSCQAASTVVLLLAPEQQQLSRESRRLPSPDRCTVLQTSLRNSLLFVSRCVNAEESTNMWP